MTLKLPERTVTKKPPYAGNIRVRYALIWKDLQTGELGEFPDMPLRKAIELTRKLLAGAYVYVELRKV